MKQFFKTALSLAVCSLLAVSTMAQTRILSGNVKDAKGDALVGVSVLVEGTTAGTYTDADGNFSLAAPKEGTTLVVKYLGMKTQKFSIGSTTNFNVAMEDDVLGLDAVVVTAIGMTAEKKALGYSVQDVSGDKLTQAGNGNTITALSGKVAGLEVISSSGAPGSAAYIQIRGATSITGDNAPLFVVDGIPVDNTQNFSGNPDNLGNNLLESVNNSNRGIDLNPDDIASISVLKGAAATALYGIRAAHGAIIISTKRGGGGSGLHGSYSLGMTWEHVTNLPDLQEQYSKGTGGAIRSYESTSSGSWGPSIDTLYWDPSQESLFNSNGEIIGATAAASTPGAIKFSPFDNVGQFFRTGQTFENNVGLSGANQMGSFRLSFGSLSQNGVVALSDFKRYTTKISGESKLSSKWNVAGSVSYVKSGGRRVQQGSNLSGLMLDLLRTPISFDNSNGSDDPEDAAAFILEDGRQRNYRGSAGYDNPYWTINQNQNHDDVNRMYGFAEVNYLPLEWLKFTERIGTDFYSDRRNQVFAVNSRAVTGGRIFQQDYFHRQVYNDILATATRKFNDDLNGSITIGQNMYHQFDQSLYVQGDNLLIPSSYTNGVFTPQFANFSNAADVLTRESKTTYRTAAMFGTVSLGYQNMLYLDISGRNEMSSTLPTTKNSFFYPSVSLAWVFTEALGMTENKYLPFGKLRLSHATVGNDAPAYALANTFAQSTSGDGWTPGIAFPENGIVSYSKDNTLGNPELKPEKTSSTEVGFDLRFLNNKLGLDFTYYSSKSTDQILPSPIAGSTGYQYMWMNTGELTNKGMEIELHATPVKMHDFTWNIDINWSKNTSKVVSLGDESIKTLFLGGFEGSAVFAVVGEEYGTIYGSRWLRDASGNVVINDDTNAADYGYPIMDAQTGKIGNINPDWIMGIGNSFTWKGISLNILFDIRQGGEIWNGTRGALTFFGRTQETGDDRNVTDHVFEGVQGHLDVDGNLVSSGAANTTAVATDQTWFQGVGSGFNGPAEQFVEDASYVKLRELSICYNLDKNWLKGTPIGSLSIAIVGRNLWLNTKYTGVDPETSLTGSNNSQGMDYFNMPGTRSFGLNLKAGF